MQIMTRIVGNQYEPSPMEPPGRRAAAAPTWRSLVPPSREQETRAQIAVRPHAHRNPSRDCQGVPMARHGPPKKMKVVAALRYVAKRCNAAKTESALEMSKPLGRMVRVSRESSIMWAGAETQRHHETVCINNWRNLRTAHWRLK